MHVSKANITSAKAARARISSSSPSFSSAIIPAVLAGGSLGVNARCPSQDLLQFCAVQIAKRMRQVIPKMETNSLTWILTKDTSSDTRFVKTKQQQHQKTERLLNITTAFVFKLFKLLNFQAQLQEMCFIRLSAWSTPGTWQDALLVQAAWDNVVIYFTWKCCIRAVLMVQ